MSKRYQIYCDYRKAINKADELVKYANKLRSIATDEINCEPEVLDKSWTGTGKEIISGKLRNTGNDIVEVSKNLIKVANTIRGIAEKNYRAEMRALEIAQNREY